MLGAGDDAVRSTGDANLEAVGFPCLAPSAVRETSPTLLSLEPLKKHDVERWVAYWRSKNFL